MEEEGVDDTSEALAMRHLTFLMGESSLGDSKSDVEGGHVVAIVVFLSQEHKLWLILLRCTLLHK
jgi:hypothetical protein